MAARRSDVPRSRAGSAEEPRPVQVHPPSRDAVSAEDRAWLNDLLRRGA